MKVVHEDEYRVGKWLEVPCESIREREAIMKGLNLISEQVPYSTQNIAGKDERMRKYIHLITQEVNCVKGIYDDRRLP